MLDVFLEAIFFVNIIHLQLCGSLARSHLAYVVVKSSLADTDSSSVFNIDVFVALDDITILSILSSSECTRVKVVVMVDVEHVAAESFVFTFHFNAG